MVTLRVFGLAQTAVCEPAPGVLCVCPPVRGRFMEREFRLVLWMMLQTWLKPPEKLASDLVHTLQLAVRDRLLSQRTWLLRRDGSWDTSNSILQH